MKIAIGCDHVGFELKGKVIEHLKEKGIEVVDFGTTRLRVFVPLFAASLIRRCFQDSITIQMCLLSAQELSDLTSH